MSKEQLTRIEHKLDTILRLLAAPPHGAARRSTNHRGGAAAGALDAWGNEAIAGGVISHAQAAGVASGSDMSKDMQFGATAAHLAAVNDSSVIGSAAVIHSGGAGAAARKKRSTAAAKKSK